MVHPQQSNRSLIWSWEGARLHNLYHCNTGVHAKYISQYDFATSVSVKYADDMSTSPEGQPYSTPGRDAGGFEPKNYLLMSVKQFVLWAGSDDIPQLVN